jgi:hypothetical protein
MNGIFTKNAYSKFDTDCTAIAPPQIKFQVFMMCGKTLQGEGENNGISKQSENFASYGWKEAS